MADIEVFVWYDTNGGIVAYGTPNPSLARRIEPVSSSDHEALRLNVPESQVDRLHETHYIDVAQRLLASREPAT